MINYQIKIPSGLWSIMKDSKWESMLIDFLISIIISDKRDNINLTVLEHLLVGIMKKEPITMLVLLDIK